MAGSYNTIAVDMDRGAMDRGALGKALAAAQSSFPVIPRNKKVTVRTKAGGSYEFSYAPLDSILAAVRGPLAQNGLAVAQLIDGQALVTMLIHESGAYLEARTPIPAMMDDIQAFGSAVTYLRRYALQAMIGIAAEEDDDGNKAAGNEIMARVEGIRETLKSLAENGSLIGTAEVGDRASSDYQIRNTPDGPALGFRLIGEKGGILVRARGPLATELDVNREAVIGHRVTVWGQIAEESFRPKGAKQDVTYQVLEADRVRAVGLPDMPLETTDTVSAPIWPEGEPL